jgi:large subunit ribosomal protein L31
MVYCQRSGLDSGHDICYTERTMQTDIHPVFYPKAKVHCACGNAFTVGSTREELSVSICAACHPFYTGTEKIVDTRGRVDRFKKRLAKTTSKAKTK